jgi:hypothetical protein
MRTHTLLLVLALSLPAAALAGDRANKPMDPERRAKVMDKIDTIRIAKLTEALELDAAGAEKLFPVLRPFQERRRAAHGQRFDALRSLEGQIEVEKPDEKAITKTLDDLMTANREIAAIAEDEYKALKPVLDPVSLARYYRFQTAFEKKIGELIREIKNAPEDAGLAPPPGGRDRKRTP